MRKIFVSIFPCCLAALLASSCGKAELKEARAVVTGMTDSTVVMSVDGEESTLLTKDVRISGGAYMPGDSVVVSYVGRLSSGEARALLVTLIPRRSEVIEAGVDLSRELKTVDAAQEQQTSEE